MNFVALARKGYFDGAPIHRVVPNFVVQDGDPTGTGNGGPGYEIRDELNTIPYAAGDRRHGALGPGHGRQPVVRDAGAAAAPGRRLHRLRPVVAGMDVVLRIEQGDRISRVTASAEEARRCMP